MAETEAPAPAASESTKDTGHAEREKAAAKEEAAYLRRAAEAEEAGDKYGDARRKALSQSELDNYERALGAPIVKGE